MEQDNPKAFLGVGLKFPVQVDENTGRMKTSSYEEDIKEAVRVILSTKKGERMRNPHFGCGIHKYAFDSLDFTTRSSIKLEVENALAVWEPRIEDIEVAVQIPREEGVVLVEISYVVRSTNTPFNMVFPYYINEGTGG
ncbi:MAG: GPW/gp25 family protein [Lachnospiraceae bacterium]|nr:GPW/gp25 family protein [Lachnospiraceae bacterium]